MEYTISSECSWNAQQNATEVDPVPVRVSFVVFVFSYVEKEMEYKMWRVEG